MDSASPGTYIPWSHYEGEGGGYGCGCGCLIYVLMALVVMVGLILLGERLFT